MAQSHNSVSMVELVDGQEMNWQIGCHAVKPMSDTCPPDCIPQLVPEHGLVSADFCTARLEFVEFVKPAEIHAAMTGPVLSAADELC